LSIVAAFSVARHGPESSSAARRKTAARSSQGVRDRPVDLGRAGLVDVGEDVFLPMRHHCRDGVAGADVLAADHAG
jgi:hypothetical protein